MRSLYVRVAVAVAVLMMAACERVQLLAPTNSTITVSAPSRVLPLGGSTEVTAFVAEQGGTPVHNGTFVRFTATLGSVNPVEVETRNGIAITTFLAGNTSGVAEVRATSGGATGATSTTGTGTGATTTTTNVVQITIGAAAVNTVTLRANPGSVPPGGGTVELIANVVAENGRALEGIAVTFNSDQGTLSSPVATTNSSGEARTFLTAGQKASVTATAGTKTSTAVTVDIRTGPGITITCTPASGTGNCAAVQASSSGNTATVVFTVAKGTSTSNLRSATLDFGDGTSQSLGNLAGGNATVTHTYTGPSSTAPRAYTATVVAVDINGETATASTAVNITPRATPTPMSIVLTAAEPTSNKTLTTARWTFSAEVTGGGDGGSGNAVIESYTWDFGDGTTATTNGKSTSHVYEKTNTGANGRITVTVTAKTADGRTVSTREEIVVTYS
jgi:hypothetical protein